MMQCKQKTMVIDEERKAQVLRLQSACARYFGKKAAYSGVIPIYGQA